MPQLKYYVPQKFVIDFLSIENYHVSHAVVIHHRFSSIDPG